ncbi:MAG: reverse transcriptase domain-containing protein [Legionellales bacterium]
MLAHLFNTLLHKAFTLSTLSLYNERSYQQEIHDLVQKSFSQGGAFDAQQDNVALFNFGFDQARLARIIARAVRRGTYRLSPPQKRLILNKNKSRAVYDYALTDKIVIKVFSRYLHALFKPFMVPELYSYQPGKNAGMAVQQLGQYIRSTRRQLSIKGLYVLKVDIQSYSDSIFIGEQSSLWPRLTTLLKDSLRAADMALLREMIRPSYLSKDGGLQTNVRGVTTGSPISNFLYNFYCAPVDGLFAHSPGLFYARFSDDILLCHPDPLELLQQAERLYAELARLQLRVHPQKIMQYYLSPAGNASNIELFQGKNSFDYLGYRIDGYGQITLSERRKRYFLRAIFRRIRYSHDLLKNTGVDEATRIRSICQVVNNALLERDFLEGEIRSLIMESNDQGQLKHLDYLIALNIAMRITNIHGVKAFARLPYKALRTTYGLCSLIKLRNRNSESIPLV